MRWLAGGVAVLGLMVQAAWAADQEQILSPTQLGQLQCQQQWVAPLETTGSGQVTAGYVRDDTLYVVTDRGEAHALHRETGLPRWSYRLNEGVYPIFAPTHFLGSDGRQLVVFTSTARLLVMDRYSGATLADLPTEVSPATAAVADEDTLFFGSQDGRFYAVYWNDPRSARAVRRWEVLAGGPVSSSPALINDGEDLVFASQSGAVYSCTAGYKILNWVRRLGGPVIGDIFVSGRAVYAASTDRSLYRLDTLSGVPRWRLRFPEPLRTGPVAAGALVYQYCEGEGLHAVEADTGRLLWTLASGRALLTARAGGTYVRDATGQILLVDREEGAVKVTVRPITNIVPVLNVEDEALYLVSPRGTVLCAMPPGSPRLSPTDLATASRELRRPPKAEPESGGAVKAVETAEPEGPVDRDDPLRSRSKLPPLAGRD